MADGQTHWVLSWTLLESGTPKEGGTWLGPRPPGSTPALLQPLRSETLQTHSDGMNPKFPSSNDYSTCGQSKGEEQSNFPRDRVS